MRLEQDLIEEAGGDLPEACARHLGAATSANDREYLRIRCIQDDRARSTAFVEAYERASSHPWLALGASGAHVSNGRWKKAADALAVARRAPVLKLRLAADLVRLLRVQAPQPDAAELGALTTGQGMLELQLATEKGGDDVPALPHMLHVGKVGAARKACRDLGDECSETLLLIGASDGAAPEWIADALAVPVGGIKAFPLIAWALAKREGQDPSRYEPAMKRHLADYFDEVSAALQLVAGGGDLDFAAVIPTASARLRGEVIAAALVLKGADAPASWRKEVRALLLAGERPHFEADPQPNGAESTTGKSKAGLQGETLTEKSSKPARPKSAKP